MENKINEILEDLYRLDPSFRDHEEKLIPIIKNLLESKPDTKFDENFAQKLRVHLMNLAHNQAQKRPRYFEVLRRLPYFLGGATAAILVFLAISTSPFMQTKLNTPLSIHAVGENAFGALKEETPAIGLGGGASEKSIATATPTAPQASPEINRDQAVSSDSGSSGFAVDLPAMTITQPAPTNVSPPYSIAPMPPIQQTPDSFTYVGGPLPKLQEKVDVLKRTKDTDFGNGALKWLNSLSLGLLNFNKFSDIYVQNFTVAENHDYGYLISLDLNEGTVNISQNWQKWPSQCPNGICAKPLMESNNSIKDVPADTEIIKIANNFITSHGIDLKNYGAPEVDGQWRVNYENMLKSSYPIYIPDSLTVRYPLLLNDKEVYYDSGSRYGIEVTVNITEKKVTGLSNLTSQNYDSSAYAAITDAQEVLDLAQKGGWPNYNYYYGGTGTGEKFQLDTPTEAYVKTFQYTDKGSSELLIPALIFPIIEPQGAVTHYYRSNVIVPLAKDLLDSQGIGIQPPDAVPMAK